MAEYRSTRDFRGATFTDADLSGATFRECDMTGVRVVASMVSDVRISGFAGELGSVVVNDVDVTGFVLAQLDERHPERVQLRAIKTADDFRAMWTRLEELWADTVARAEGLAEAALHQRVDDEWSFVETLRHLVFAIDVWVGRMLLGELMPYHRLGLPPTDYPDSGAPELGIELQAEVPFSEAVAIHADRMSQVRGVLADLTDEQLWEIRTGVPAPVWGEESHSVAACLKTVMNEHSEHRRYAERDLARLSSPSA